MGQAQNGAARVPPEMVAALDRGALVLTSSSRLARSLRRQYSLRKKQSGATQWPSPRILSWSGWLSDLWKLCLFQGLPGVPLLLNTFQERMLWNSAIRQSPEAAHLLQIDSTAAAAQQAWNLLHRYRIPVQRAAFQVSEDTAAFFEWSRVYKTQIKRLNALDAARLSDWIRDRFVQGALAAPSQLWLAGFEESTPQQEVLLKALEQAGCPIVESQFLDLPAQDTALHSYPDQTSEVYAAAAWAREKLERDPGCSVGIVTPNLTEVRAFAARALRELLDDAFHIPTGRPLGSLPIIHAALLVLETFLPRLERETVTGILLSPYLAAGEEERAARARLDATLRSYGGLHWPVQALADAAMRENAQGGIAREPESGVPSKVGGAVSALCTCPNLVAAVERCEKVPDALPPSAWAHLFAQRLQNFGWLTGPLGNRRKTDLLAANLGPVSPWDSVAQRAHFALLLDNDEAQAVDAWRDALTHMSSLDLVSSELTAFDALSLLRRIVGDTPFTGEDLGQPVHLMSISEAAGSDFDHLWIMGLHEDAWPAPPSPTPFLPITLQAAHKVPGCTPRSQLAQAAGLTRRLLASAGHIVVSYPMMLAERPLGPSPLLGNARKTEPAPQPFALVAPLSAGASAGAGYTHWYLQPAELESLLDIRAPLLPEGSIAPGGARTLEMQAACPFRAFAEMRLGARPLESPDLGLDPRQRGKLIHKAMELFWHRLRSQDNLRQLAPAQLDSLVEDSVKESLRFTRLPGGLFHDKLKDLEISRLSAMVHEWLALERERAPFTVVASEQKRDIALAGLHLSTRVDRVDQLPDGSHVLIDYKTNAPSPDAWDGRRPDQPQLPLYALTFQERGGQERAGQEHAGTTELRLRESLQVPSTHGGPAGPAPAFDAPLAAVAFAQMRTGDMRFRGRASQDGLLPGVDAVDSFEQLPRDWRTVLEKLATNYRDGHAEVDPKFESTCDFCHLHSLCRIHE